MYCLFFVSNLKKHIDSKKKLSKAMILKKSIDFVFFVCYNKNVSDAGVAE